MKESLTRLHRRSCKRTLMCWTRDKQCPAASNMLITCLSRESFMLGIIPLKAVKILKNLPFYPYCSQYFGEVWTPVGPLSKVLNTFVHPSSFLYRDIGCFCNITFIYLYGTFFKKGDLWACNIQFFWECKGRPVCLPSILIVSSYFGVQRPWLCRERSHPNINRWTWAIMLRNREDPYEASWCTLNHSFQSTHTPMMGILFFNEMNNGW